MNASEIKEKFDHDVANWNGIIAHLGSVVGVLEKACGGKPNRHLILKFLTGKTSSKDLTPEELSALYNIVLPMKPEGGKWGSGNPDLERICGTILAASYDQPGQIKMFEPELGDVSAGRWEEQVENPAPPES